MQIIKPKRIRLEDIAKMADISISATSMALADHPGISPRTKHRVLTLSRKLGYHKSEPRLNSRRTHKIGLMLVGDQLERPGNTAVLSRCMSHGPTKGFRMEVAAVGDVEDRKAVLESILAFCSGLDGVLLSGLVQQSDIARVHQLDIPCVVLGQIAPDPRYPEDPLRRFGHIVGGDDIAMGRHATTWLASRGHRRIAFVCSRLPKGFYHDRWLAGYRLGLADSGIASDPALIQVTDQISGGAPPADVAADAIMKIADRPTGFVVPDSRIGVSLIEALRARGVEVDLKSVVLAGMPDSVPQHYAEHLPMISASIQETVDVSIHHLLSLRSHPPARFLQTFVSTETHNMD